MSTPGSTFTMIHGVPGFLRVSKYVSWTISQAIGGVTAVLTVFVQPMLASSMANVHAVLIRTDLLSVGKLLTAVLVPAVVIIATDEGCFGMWVKFWGPCLKMERHHHGGTNSSFDVDLGILDQMFVELGDNQGGVPQHLITSHELCSMHSHIQPRRCVRSMLERNTQLLMR
eukprot:711736-Amphidinium_carterae.1